MRLALVALGPVLVTGVACSGPRVVETPPPPPAVTAATVAVADTRPPTGPAELLAAAPELTPRSAALLCESTPAELTAVERAERGLVLATAGFARTRPQDVTELGTLFGRAYASLTPAERDWMPSYMERVRRGDVGEAERARGRTLLTRGISSLPAQDLDRLRAILETAIVEGMAAEREARKRTAEYVPMATPPPAQPTPPAAGVRYQPSAAGQTSGRAVVRNATDLPRSEERIVGGANEAGWRRRIEVARARVADAEQRLADTEVAARKAAYGGSPGRDPCLPAPGVVISVDKHQKCVSELNASSQADAERRAAALERARQQLAAARKALEELEEDARRKDVPPGWLR